MRIVFLLPIWIDEWAHPENHANPALLRTSEH